MNTKLNPQRMIIRTQSIRNRKAPELTRGQESIEKYSILFIVMTLCCSMD